MRHLQFMRFNNRVQSKQASVHIQKDDKLTWCGLRFMSDQTFEGRPISLVSETTRPVTCKRCGSFMTTELVARLRHSKPQAIENVWELMEGMNGH